MANEWRKCAMHGSIDPASAWGCPDCVESLRREVRRTRRLLRLAEIHMSAFIPRTEDDRKWLLGEIRLELETRDEAKEA